MSTPKQQFINACDESLPPFEEAELGKYYRVAVPMSILVGEMWNVLQIYRDKGWLVSLTGSLSRGVDHWVFTTVETMEQDTREAYERSKARIQQEREELEIRLAELEERDRSNSYALRKNLKYIEQKAGEPSIMPHTRTRSEFYCSS